MVVAGLLCLGITTSGRAEDWPQWRGIHRDGIWGESDIVRELPSGQLPLTWSVPIGPGYSGPTVAQGLVYIMDRQVMETQQTERILCFDAATGKEVWRVEYEAPYSVGYTAGPRASVTVDRGSAYAVGAMGHFHCLDARTGKINWKINLAEQFGVEMPIWGIAASPLVMGDLVIQQVSGKPNACLVAFDRTNGKEVWRALDEGAGYSSPILIQQHDRPVVVAWTADSLSGLDAQTGQLYWTHAMRPTRMPIGIGTPSVDGELIFVSSFYDGSMMVRAPKDSLTSELVWRAIGPDEKNTGASEVLLGAKTHSDGATYGIHAMIGTSIVQNGSIYGVDSYGEFRCLEALTGRRIWEDRQAVPIDRWATIHMVRHADDVWMLNERGELLITQFTPNGLKILSRSQLLKPTEVQLNQRGGVCWSHPAYAEQSIFARNDEQLVRASLKDEK